MMSISLCLFMLVSKYKKGDGCAAAALAYSWRCAQKPGEWCLFCCLHQLLQWCSFFQFLKQANRGVCIKQHIIQCKEELLLIIVFISITIPVCPYAMMLPLYPSNTETTIWCAQISYTSSCVELLGLKGKRRNHFATPQANCQQLFVRFVVVVVVVCLLRSKHHVEEEVLRLFRLHDVTDVVDSDVRSLPSLGLWLGDDNGPVLQLDAHALQKEATLPTPSIGLRVVADKQHLKSAHLLRIGPALPLNHRAQPYCNFEVLTRLRWRNGRWALAAKVSVRVTPSYRRLYQVRHGQLSNNARILERKRFFTVPSIP